MAWVLIAVGIVAAFFNEAATVSVVAFTTAIIVSRVDRLEREVRRHGRRSLQ